MIAIGKARADKVRRVFNAAITKNVPHDMVGEYMQRGWLIHSTHRNYVTLAWIHEGNPP